jgi:GTP-binding protein HflX
LDEIREADIILHVVDMSHPYHENHIEVVSQTLAELNAANIPVILVLNKVDLVKKQRPDFEEESSRGYYREMGFDKIIFIAATKKQNIQALKQLLFEEVRKKHLIYYPNYTSNGYEFSFIDNKDTNQPT